MTKLFPLQVDSINGEILEFPQSIEVDCSGIFPMGYTVIRDYDSVVNNIIAKKVFLVKYRNNIFGTTQFKTDAEFRAFVASQCKPCPCGSYILYINKCQLTINGCQLTFYTCGIRQLNINNCSFTLNGCAINLN